MSNCAKFGRFPAIRSWDQFSRRSKKHILRNGQFSAQIRIENQCNWATLMDFFTNFTTEFFTQFSPADPFEIELYEETNKPFSSKVQFWPNSHALTLSQQPGGGGGLCPPPPPGILPQISWERLELRAWTFWQFKWTNFQSKKIIFNHLHPPLVSIATTKVDACFEKHISAVFMEKLTRTRRVFANSIKSVSNVVCCGNFSLIFRWMVSWWQFSFCTLFHASTTSN